MRLFIYDHKPLDMPSADFYITLVYLDESKAGNNNYIFLDVNPLKTTTFGPAASDLYDFSNTKINGKTIKELTSFKGISLWWFYEADIRKKYMEYLGSKSALQGLLERLGAKEATLCLMNPAVSRAARDCCKEKGIDVKEIQDTSSQRSRYPYYAYYLMSYLIAVIVGKMHFRRKRAPILIASYTKYWTKFNVTKDVRKDGIFHEVQEDLRKRGLDYVGIEYKNESIMNFLKTQVEKWWYERGYWVPATAYTSINIFLSSLRDYRRIKRDLSSIQFDRDEQKYILNLLIGYLGETLFEIINVYCLNRAIDEVSPSVLLTSCEYCTMGRAAVILGNIKGIKTVALQHGVIAKTSSEYIFHNREMTTFSEGLNLRPIPRYTLVYGSSYRDILVEGSTYPMSSVVITGQPRYDILASSEINYSKDEFLKKMGLSPGKRLIFCTTDGLPESKIYKNVYALFEVVKEMGEDVQLFIKPHPNNIDRDFYIRVRDELGVDAPIISDIDLYRAIYVSDVLITWFSTTALEAILLNRPVVILNLTSDLDYASYIQEGVAFAAYSKEELASSLQRIFRGERCPEEKRRRFMDKYAYKIDGEAASRVVDVIIDCTIDLATEVKVDA